MHADAKAAALTDGIDHCEYGLKPACAALQHKRNKEADRYPTGGMLRDGGAVQRSQNVQPLVRLSLTARVAFVHAASVPGCRLDDARCRLSCIWMPSPDCDRQSHSVPQVGMMESGPPLLLGTRAEAAAAEVP